MTPHLSAPARPIMPLLSVLTLLIAGALGLFLSILPANAAERERVEAFLNVTGFDVALDSIAFSASSAPAMLGLEEDAFGADWNRVADQVFDTKVMHDMALEILQATLEDGPLDHAVSFYASELGQRLVVAENAAHMDEDDEARQAEGRRILDDLMQDGAERVEIFERMNSAIDSSDTSLRALQEIQIRFLMAASAAGVIDRGLDVDRLRALMQEQEGQMRRALRQSALAGAAWTYRDFSDEDLRAYAQALEQPDMQLVYELLNAVQFEIMANRFEVLAARMADLHPGQDI